MNNSEQSNNISPTKQALLALKKLQAKVDALEYARTEPIAIISMGCRFPGGVNSPEQFWDLLHQGIDAITEVPKERWDIDAFYDSDPEASGKMYTRYGGFLDNIDEFDPQFFGIAPREAVMLDPQQRIWLEVCWEALERANIPQKSIIGSNTGIFVGTEHHDYLDQVTHSTNQTDMHTATGNMLSIVSGRLAYFLGTQGPTMTIDTACSASLVAIHLACQSLRSGECELALAGGVNLILSPLMSLLGSRARALSPDGCCKAFAASGDGYGRGEGCGVLVLKRVSDAISDGDEILAVISGSAVTHDGQSSGLTVPNGLSQQRVIRNALENAGIKPNEVQYVEAHGTGTSLGDPIEVEALGAVFGERKQPLLIGSVKTNLAHLEAAAGVAGVIKTVLAIQHGEIPPHLHFDKPSPHIDWDKLSVEIPTSVRSWPTGKRTAGVSSFSLNGTNVHAILQQPPSQEVQSSVNIERPLHLLTLSAQTEKALVALSQRYEKYFEATLNQPKGIKPTLADICFSSNVGRTHFEHRLSFVASSLVQAYETIAAFNHEEKQGIVFKTPTKVHGIGKQAKVAFLFTGQGSQYVNMGRQLYETNSTFRQAIEQCDNILSSYLEIPLVEVLYIGDKSPLLNQTAYTQPVLFALEYALVKLWESWGIEADVVMGHSVGEYVAACVAGVFSLEDGLKLIAERGKLIQALPQDGEMVVVETNEAEVRKIIRPHVQYVSIAALNGPQNTVISGMRHIVQTVVETFKAAGIKTKTLTVSHAFHSPLMEPMISKFERVAREVTYYSPQRTLISNLTGEIASVDIASPEYWCRHIRQPVRFADGMQILHQQGYDIFLEIGPKPVLLGMGQQCLPSNTAVWLPSLRQGQDDWQQMLNTLAQLYVHGVTVDWSEFNNGYCYNKVVLPTYPFQRKPYWIKEQTSAGDEFTKTPIVDMLYQGDAKQLTHLIDKTDSLSQEEKKLLPKIMQQLVEQHQQQLSQAKQQEENQDNCLYEITWQPKPRQDIPIAAVDTGSWLILADQTKLGQTLAELLIEQGQTVFLVYPDEVYINNDSVWQLNPASPTDFERLFKEISLAKPLQGIVHLWSIDVEFSDNFTTTSLDNSQILTCGSTLHLIQAIIKQGLKSKLWFVTQGAVSIGNHPVSVAQASLWGLGKVIALEYPQLWGGMLDLPLPSDKTTTYDWAVTILTEILDPQREDQLAFRTGQRYVARIGYFEDDRKNEVILPRLHSDASYLITGGLGDLGMHVARWLIKQGVKHLILTGRGGATGKEGLVDQLTELGTEVKVVKADVANAEDVTKMMIEIEASMPPLRGIVHAAGLLDDGILLQQSWERFKKVMNPKIAGSWHLYSQTKTYPLDFFVLFSSATSLLGTAGQGSYAAANAFMDALAQHGKVQGKPFLSICWAGWDAGMAARLDKHHMQRGANKGINLISPKDGLQVFGKFLNLLPSSVIGVLPIDWADFADNPLAQQPLFSNLIETSQTEQINIISLLEKALPYERVEILKNYLKTAVANALGTDELPDAQQGFFDMGMDSLIAVELSNKLQKNLNINFPSTIIFEYPSVNALNEYLLNEVLSLTEPEVSTVSSQKNDLSDKNLSQSELVNLIEQELAEIMEMDK